MAFDFSTLVTDRKQSDVAYVKQLISKLVEGTATEAELAEWKSFTLKGSYNYTDLNRVNAAMEQLKAQLEGYGYAVPGYRKVQIPHTKPPSSRLPNGYTELKYIESTGTQYVNTGFKPNQDTRVVVDIEATISHAKKTIFGARIAYQNTDYTLWYTNDTTLQSNYGSSALAPLAIDSILQRLTIDKNKNVVTCGNYSCTNTENTFQSDLPMFLFGMNQNGSLDSRTVSAKLYSCQIYDNGTLVRDYAPCMTTNGEIGLYDAVNEEFYGNSGTGMFLAGPRRVTLPDDYRQVEYIESNGTQYIDTGYSNAKGFRTVVDFELTSIDSVFKTVVGSHNTSAPYSRNLVGIQSGKFFVGVDEPYEVATTVSSGVRYNVDFSSIYPNVYCNINGVNAWSKSLSSPSLSTLNVLIGADQYSLANGGSLPSMKLYACQIYGSDTLVRDFVPCVNPSGAYGLYDTVNAQFYGNASTGSFIGGAVVEWDAINNEQTDYDPYLWYEIDTPTPQLMENYLANVQSMRNVLALFDSTPATPDSMSGLTYSQANAIEQILFDIDKAIKQTVGSFVRLNAFTAVSGNRPLPSVDKDIGRTWAELDAMQTIWRNWDVATWFLLLHGNLTAVETEV